MARAFRISNGIAAVWDGHPNYAPFFDPFNNINAIKFHSAIPYVKIIDVRDFTVNIPAISNTPDRSVSYTLGPHGRPGQPFIVGQIVVGGVPVAFTGSVPVHQGGGSFSTVDPLARWLALGADATNVYVHEYAVQFFAANTGNGAPRPAQSFAIRCYITDILL